MKLCDVPKNSRVRVIGDVKTPPSSNEIGEQEELNFSSIDGMYSYCTRDNGEVVQLVAWVDVEVINQKK